MCNKEEKQEGTAPAEGGVGDISEDESPEVYKAYNRRWAILVTLVFLNIANASIWINVAPVATTMATYFNRQAWEMNWFSLIYIIITIPFTFISTLFVDKMGFKVVVHIGAGLTCAAGVLRALATSGIIPDDQKDAQYGLSLFGQTLGGMAQAFVLFVPTKLSQLWFPKDQRAISTTLVSLSNPLGIVVAQVVSPTVVQSQDDIPTLNYIFMGVALFAEILAIVSVTRAKPPTPPSGSAEKSEDTRAGYLAQLKAIFTCWPYLCLVLALGAGIGLVSAQATVTQQILCSLGYSDEFSGLSIAILFLCGFVGSACSGILCDKTKAFTPITKICYGTATFFAIIMFEFYLVPKQEIAIAIFSGLFGFFGVGGYPVGLELAVEATYPVEEMMSTAFVFLSGQLQGFVIIAIVSGLSQDPKPHYSDIEVCTAGGNDDIKPRDYSISLMVIMGLLVFVVCTTILFFHTEYKRLKAETSRKSTSCAQRTQGSSENDNENISQIPATVISY
ncbi:unnamed protein product, partial [Meganyctiphanes norvegica]